MSEAPCSATIAVPHPGMRIFRGPRRGRAAAGTAGPAPRHHRKRRRRPAQVPARELDAVGIAGLVLQRAGRGRGQASALDARLPRGALDAPARWRSGRAYWRPAEEKQIGESQTSSCVCNARQARDAAVVSGIGIGCRRNVVPWNIFRPTSYTFTCSTSPPTSSRLCRQPCLIASPRYQACFGLAFSSLMGPRFWGCSPRCSSGTTLASFLRCGRRNSDFPATR